MHHDYLKGGLSMSFLVIAICTFLLAIFYIMHMTSRPDFNFQDCTSSNVVTRHQ